MGPYAKWTTDGMKIILKSNVVAYKDTTDRGTNDTRSKLISKITRELQAYAKSANEPFDAEGGEEVLKSTPLLL